jgi:hypothetical protein
VKYIRPCAGQHSPCNGDLAVPRLRLRPNMLVRHDPFLIRAMPGHISTGTSLIELRSARPDMDR